MCPCCSHPIPLTPPSPLPLCPLALRMALFSSAALLACLFTVNAQAAPATVTRVNAMFTQQVASGTGGLFGVLPVNAANNYAVQCFNGDCPQNPPCPTTATMTPGNILFSGTAVSGPVPAVGARFTAGLCCCASAPVLVYWSAA